MAQRPSEYNYVANDAERTITFLNPPLINESRYTRWYHDLGERILFFSIGNGYTQNQDNWIGKYEQEEFNCVIRFLNKFGWVRQ